MVAKRAVQSIIDEEKAGGCREHAFQHDARGGSSDTDAVEQKGGESCQRDGKHPIEIGG